MEKNIFHKTSDTVREWLRYHFLEKKMATPFGIAMLGFIAIAMSYITVLISYQLSVGLAAAVGVVLLCVLCVVYPVVGFYGSYLVSLFLMFPARISNSAAVIPTGLIPEYLSYLTLMGLLTRHNYRGELNAKFWNNIIVVWTMLLLAYYTIELLNLASNSVIGWFNFVRKQFSFAIFLVVSYSFLNSRKAIVIFTRFWVVFSTIEALYACQQKWFGFANFEYLWLISDPKRFDLFVNGGFVRMFGLLSDPAAAGILYACTTTFILILALRTQSVRKRIVYYILTVIHFLASSYTGTRTATLMIIAGMVFYCILTLYERRTLIFSAFFGFMIVGLMVAPIYSNPTINRLRSAFEGSDDPSAKTRDLNRQLVQPYVYSHPIGGGLNTAGLVGQTYNPGHYLSMIPPDSAYMQTMMEQGPIGLALMMIYYYLILRAGIKYFYRVRDPSNKTLYLAYMVSIFTMMVAQFSQMAIGQYPSVFFVYTGLAVLLKLHQYDPSYKETTEKL